MNARLLICALLVSSVAYGAEPRVNLDRVEKDISIMRQIIATAMEDSGLCRECSDEIKGTYLAEQGVVFTVSASTTYYRFISRRGGDSDDDFHFEVDDIYTIDIPAAINDAMSRIEIVGADGDRFSWGALVAPDPETRREIRDIARNKRRVEAEVRELEIEMIHLDEEEKERQELETRLGELQEQVAELEKDQARIESIQEEKLEAYQQKREEERRAREERREKVVTRVEETLLEAVCDYGSTMKNIPSDEKVSLVLRTDGLFSSERKSRVFVLSVRDVSNCKLGEAEQLRDKAIVYEI